MNNVRNKASKHNRDRSADKAVTDDQAANIKLVQKAADRDFEAFGELYSIYLDRIFRYIFYQVKDKMTAEDLTEEVFVKAWRAIDSCKGREETFSSWLYRIAQNHVIDSLRSKKRRQSLETEMVDSIADAAQTIGGDLEWQELLGEITYLPQSQRQVIILKFVEGLDNREAAKILGKSQGAVRILQMRALAALRKELDKEK